MEWKTKPSSYPSSSEVDHWIEKLHQKAYAIDTTLTDLKRSGVTPAFGNGHTTNYTSWWKIEAQGREPFYAIWQPALRSPAPVVIHLPGYGAETSVLPELVQAGYHVLHVSPLGYMTPDGPNNTLKVKNEWPVLPNTVFGKKGGYEDFLLDAMIAIRHVMKRDDVMRDRLLFWGTSQGGGTSLLMASIYHEFGVKAVVADVPFLINFPITDYAYWLTGLTKETIAKEHWNRIGYIDVMSHLHRLTMPILLTAGEVDTACPPHSIQSLFDHLDSTKSYNYFKGQWHAYTRQAIHLGLAWYNLHS